MRIFWIIVINIIAINLNAQITFVIESLPNTTPTEDSIFLTGTFNNWNVNDENYVLHTQLDGKYSITLPIDTGVIEFKFTRGSWSKVETSKTNEQTRNRVVSCRKGKIYTAKIENWQDLGGVKEFNYTVLLIFALGFFGLITLLFIFRLAFYEIKDKNLLIFFNSFLIISLFLYVFYSQAHLIWKSRIEMLGLIGLFIWGPILLFLVSSLSTGKIKIRIFHLFLPVCVVLITTLRLLNFDFLNIYSEIYDGNLTWGDAILTIIGIVTGLIYHFIAVRTKLKAKKDKIQQFRINFLLNTLLVISSVALVLFIQYFVLRLLKSSFLKNGVELVLILMSIILFVEFLYYLKNNQLFQKTDKSINIISENKPKSLIDDNEKNPLTPLAEEMVEDIKRKLLEQMKVEKVYKDPELKIAKLSRIIETKSHILSRVLNEQFNKSFRDFINEYRINEFIKLAKSEKYKNYTLLALSYEVGFNSKSTFNLAFKKVTGTSPRNFLKSSKIELE